MGFWSELKADVAAVIKANYNQEITGTNNQAVLFDMIDSLGKYHMYSGLATPTTDPSNPDEVVFYIATTPGTYTNFKDITTNPIEVGNDSITILKGSNDTWSKDVIPLPKQIDFFTELLDTPNSYNEQAGRVPIVNATETGLVFTDFDEDVFPIVHNAGQGAKIYFEQDEEMFFKTLVGDEDWINVIEGDNHIFFNVNQWIKDAIANIPSEFLQLNDTPNDYAGASNYFVKVNDAGTALEFVYEFVPEPYFITLDDTPSSYTGESRKVVTVAPAEDAVEFNFRMNWRNKWFQTTYYTHDVVTDGSWTMVANKETTDRAAPQPSGTPYWTFAPDLTWTSDTVNAGFYASGQRYTFTESCWVNGYRVYIPSDNPNYLYRPVIIDRTDPANPLVQYGDEVYSLEIGWLDVNIASVVVQAGSVIDLVLALKDTSQGATFAYDWDYDTPNNWSTPSSGQITHANKRKDFLSISDNDNAGTNRSADLATVQVGDVIRSGGTEWSVTSVSDEGSYYDFGVTPPTQLATTGVLSFTFTVQATAPLPFVEIVNHWNTATVPVADVVGVAVVDQPLSELVTYANAFGTDINIQEATVSEDWDTLAVSGEGSSGGSTAPTAFTDLTDTPDTYSGSDNMFLRVNEATGVVFEAFSWGMIGGDINNQSDLIDMFNTKLNVVSPFTADNFPSFGVDGQLMDSGYSITEFLIGFDNLGTGADLITSTANNIIDIRSILGEVGFIDITQNALDVTIDLDQSVKDALESIPDVSGKADKVVGATNGNLAGLDATGNLTDSGSKPSDFATSAQGDLADSAVQPGDPVSVLTNDVPYATVSQLNNKADKVSGATDGNIAGLDATGNLTDSGVDPDQIVEIGDNVSVLVNDVPYLTGGDIPDISVKADKVIGATTDNLAGLNYEGNLQDSGAKISDFATDEQGDLADTALQPGDNVSELVNDVPYLVSADVSNKADKVQPVTAGNLAGLDSTGNLTDSGSKPADFATDEQGDLADTALQPGDNVSELVNNVPYLVAADIDDKADKVNGATAGNFAGLDATGNLTDSGFDSNDFATDEQGDLADTALQAGDNVSLLVNDVPYATVSEIPDITTKADKVVGATNGNFAGLDATGNLTDSGFDDADFATDTQGDLADTALQPGDNVSELVNDVPYLVSSDLPDISVKADKVQPVTAGNLAGLDATGNLTDSGSSVSDFATDEQGDLADTALQPGDNVSELANDVPYLVASDISGKADKVQPVVAGNLAGLDATGNLTDSGSKTDDFATDEQGDLADTALQPGDNISELVNDVPYVTTEPYDTIGINDGLGAKTVSYNEHKEIHIKSLVGDQDYIDVIEGDGSTFILLNDAVKDILNTTPQLYSGYLTVGLDNSSNWAIQPPGAGLWFEFQPSGGTTQTTNDYFIYDELDQTITLDFPVANDTPIMCTLSITTSVAIPLSKSNSIQFGHAVDGVLFMKNYGTQVLSLDVGRNELQPINYVWTGMIPNASEVSAQMSCSELDPLSGAGKIMSISGQILV